MLNERRFMTVSPLMLNAVRLVSWLFVLLAMLNALYFVLRASSPVIQADSWWFLDVFVRKAIDGNLGFADFFIKRGGGDHAQPLFKLVLLLEWRYFDLDFVVGAVFGVIAVAACAAVLHRVVLAQCSHDGSRSVRYLAWAAMCALLFSLNSLDPWTWPLVALENITTLVILLFMLAVWYAHRRQRYVLLAIATLVLGISSDDSALIAVLAVVLALLLAAFADPAQRGRSLWKTLAVIGACMLLVRIGYAHAPGAGGASLLVSQLKLLPGRFLEGGWWQWLLWPLVLPVSYHNPFPSVQAHIWFGIQVVLGVLLLIAHVLFWRRAFRGPYDRPVFVAVGLMLLSYGWVVGILLGRVAVFGNDYLVQPRYVLLYAGHLIALLLMWVGSSNEAPRVGWWRHAIGTGVSVMGCLLLLAVQIPLSTNAWHMRPYEWDYYAKMAGQIDALARDPVHDTHCEMVPMCGGTPEQRRDLTQLLSENRLNIYSPQVQHWHHYLPTLSPVPAITKSDIENPTKVKPD
ncbi:MAG: hypothetical protein WA777_02505 [Rhodanobacter sp.]